MVLQNSKEVPSQRLGALAIFLDDIEKIHALATSVQSRVRYRFNDFSGDEVEDLKSLGQELNRKKLDKLTIYIRASSDGGFITIRLGGSEHYGNMLEIDRATQAQLGLQILGLLKSRRRGLLVQFLHAHPLLWWGGLYATALASLGITAYLFFPSQMKSDSFASILGISAGAFFLASILSFIRRTAARTQIHLYERSAHVPLFGWSDYKVYINYIITFLIGAILGHFTK